MDGRVQQRHDLIDDVCGLEGHQHEEERDEAAVLVRDAVPTTHRAHNSQHHQYDAQEGRRIKGRDEEEAAHQQERDRKLDVDLEQCQEHLIQPEQRCHTNNQQTRTLFVQRVQISSLLVPTVL